MTSADRPERHPQDWYVEEAWTIRPLVQMIPFRKEGLLWDPACGLGTIPTELRRLGLQAEGTDLMQRTQDFMWGTHDFMCSQSHMMESYPFLSFVSNIPYGYERRIAERFVRKMLSLAREHVAVLVPLKWKASEERYSLFTQYPPSDVLILCDRPSMPPGDKLHERDEKGQLKAFRRGKQDYCWIVWDRHRPAAETRTRWIKPRTREQKIIDREYDLRRVGLLPQLEEAA